jgi:Na+-transporting methylmalonyl-CoA/oxaloacetate decarboxylase gamma subunit
MKGRILIVFCTLALAATAAFGQGLNNFKLNEVVVSNTKGLMNEDGEHVAWIEIANTSWSSTDLSGCYITNDPSVLDNSLTAPQRIARMSLIRKGDARTDVAPKGHIVLFADGKTNLGLLHTKFMLQPGKENFVALYEANGTKLIDKVTVPANLPADCSWARFVDAKSQVAEWRVCPFNKVSPNTANAGDTGKEDKVAEWKAQDPYGVAMTILGMGIVFSGLVFLCIFFNIFGWVARKISASKNAKQSSAEPTKKASRSAGKASDAALAVASYAATQAFKEAGVIAGDEDEIAVIAMALHEELDAHDEESGIITIVPTNSPWKQRGIELAKRLNK